MSNHDGGAMLNQILHGLVDLGLLKEITAPQKRSLRKLLSSMTWDYDCNWGEIIDIDLAMLLSTCTNCRGHSAKIFRRPTSLGPGDDASRNRGKDPPLERTTAQGRILAGGCLRHLRPGLTNHTHYHGFFASWEVRVMIETIRQGPKELRLHRFDKQTVPLVYLEWLTDIGGRSTSVRRGSHRAAAMA
jgi:hypothetical protein